MATRDHAVVIGGGIAGLLAARAAADHYAHVTVFERDEVHGDASGLNEPRKAIPQGRHIHALLGRGKLILDELFPGMIDELAASGVPVGDFGTTCHWYFNGNRIAPVEAGLTCVAAGRPLLERTIRSRVQALANVTFRDGHEVTGLRHDSGAVRGVSTYDVHTSATEDVTADLVVDATGRTAGAARWLTELGYRAPAVDVVRMDLSYTTCDFAGPLPFDPIGDNIAIIPAATPASPRGAIFARLPDRYAVSLTGVLGDPAPRSHAEFLDYVKTLPVPEIWRAVADARPLAPPATFRFPESRRVRYDKLKDFPSGLLVIGDAFSAFNPVYGQGMTVAAMAAEYLRSYLGGTGEPRPRRFHRHLAHIVSAPWNMASGADLAYAGVRGHRTPATKIANAYVARMQDKAVTDPVLARQFLRVAGLVDSPMALFAPAVLSRTLLGWPRPVATLPTVTAVHPLDAEMPRSA